jgi:hypothetical protein
LAGQFEKKSKKCRGIRHTPPGLGFWCNAQNPGLAARNRVIFGVCVKTALENFCSGNFCLWKILSLEKPGSGNFYNSGNFSKSGKKC